MSVTSCLKDNKFAEPEDKKLFEAVKKEYREDGLDNTDAARKAINEVITAIEKEHTEFAAEVEKQGGEMPDLITLSEGNKETVEKSEVKTESIESYGGNKPNYKNKKTGELFYSDGEMSYLNQATFINRFNESKEVVNEKMGNYERLEPVKPETTQEATPKAKEEAPKAEDYESAADYHKAAQEWRNNHVTPKPENTKANDLAALNKKIGLAEKRLSAQYKKLNNPNLTPTPIIQDAITGINNELTELNQKKSELIKQEAKEYPLADRGEWWGDADYKQRGGVLTDMTPDEYLSQVKPVNEASEATQENVNDLVDHVNQGRTLDPLVIYKDGKEDGRHRALMAKKLGIKKVPVIDFREEAKPQEAKKETAKLKNTDDVGGEMSYNRRQKGLTIEDIKGAKNDTEKLVLAKKPKLWERPDYQEMIDGGINPMIAHSIKQIYDLIPNKPAYNKDKYIYAYVEGVEALRKAADELLADKKAMVDLQLSMASKADKRLKQSFDILEQFGENKIENYILDRVFPKNKAGNRWGRGNEEGNDRANALGNRLYKGLSFNLDGFVKAIKAIEEGWPAKGEAWQRSYKILPKDRVVDVRKMQTHKDDEWIDQYRVQPTQEGRVYFDTKEEADKYVETLPEWYLLKKKGGLVDVYKSKDAALTAVRELTKKAKLEQFKEPNTPVEKSIREGRDFRNGQNVSTQDIKDVIGFKAVNFGNWMKGESAKKKQDRQAHANSIYDSAHDLAEILNVPVQAISLNGMLGVAVGAQGKGGRAAAHFVPGVNEINITKTKGAGSLAHEFAHGLDHYFGTLAGMAKRDDPFLSDLPYGKTDDTQIRPEIVEHFRTIVKTMKKIDKGYTKEEIEQSRIAGLERSQRYLDSWLKNIAVEKPTRRYTSLVNKLKTGDVGKMGSLGKSSDYVGDNVNALREEYKKIKGRYFGLDTAKSINANAHSIANNISAAEYYKNHPTSRPVSTNYQKYAVGKESQSALSGTGKLYWSTPWEMFARAFEIYVASKLAENSNRNDYLTSAWKMETEGYLGEEAKLRHPQGIEREKINLAFDALIGELKTKETDQGTALYSRTQADTDINPLPYATVKASVDKLMTRFKRLKHEVYSTESELPAELQAQAEKEGATGDIKAVYWDNKVYVVADKFENNQQIEEAVLHEVAGHYGARVLYGKGIEKVFTNLYAGLRSPGVQRIAKENGINLNDYIEASKDMSYERRAVYLVDELLAHLQGKAVYESLPARFKRKIQSFIGAVRHWLNEKGFIELAKLSDSDMAYMLQRMNQAALDGKSAKSGDTAAFMRSDTTEEGVYNINDKTASYTTKRLFNILSRKSNPDKSINSAVAYVDPKDFIAATSIRTDEIYQEKKITQDMLEDSDNVPTLMVKKDGDQYVILDHDGRHRMAYLADQGVTRAPIIITDIHNSHDTMGLKDGDTIPAQFDEGELTITSPIDVSLENSDELEQTFSEPESDIRFSRSAEDAEQSFLNKINPDKPFNLKEKYGEFKENLSSKIRQGLVDRYDALYELDKKVYGQDVVQENTNLSSWVLAKMSSASEGAVHAMLDYGRIKMDSNKTIDMQTGEQTPLINVLHQLGSGEEINRFMGWVAANRANKLLAEGRENLFTPEEIKAGMGLNKGKEALYQKVYQQFNAFQKDVLDIAKQSGVISKAQAEDFANEMYVPFYRVMSDEDIITHPIPGNKLSRQQAYKKLKGGQESLRDLLDNTLINFNHLISASLRNNAANQAVKNAEKVEVAEKTTEAQRDKKSSTFVLQDGKKVWYDITDPMVFNALTSLSDLGMNQGVMRIMRKFKRMFTAFVTASPQFIVANMLRDSIQAAAIGKVSKVNNAVTGALRFNDKNKLKHRMVASGGAFSFGHIYMDDPGAIRQSIDRELRGGHIITKPGDVLLPIKRAWDKYQSISNRGENANRAAIYEQAIKDGKTHQQAAFEARDLMDFSSRGEWAAIRVLTDIVPFLGARLVGLDALNRKGLTPSIRAAFGNGTNSDRIIAKRFSAVQGAVMLASMALYMAYKDDEDFKEREDWDRDTYWWFKVGDSAFKIPKPFEIGSIGTMAERILEQFVDDKATGKLFAERFGHMINSTFAFNPMPQMLKPVYDVYSNKDSFTGRTIESPGMRNLSPSQRSRANTTDLAKVTSSTLENTFGAAFGKKSSLVLSPVQVDYLIQNYLGWVGAAANGTVDDIINFGEKPLKHWQEYQPIRRFYQDLPSQYSKYVTQFYDNMSEVNQIYADINNYRKLGEMERAQELFRENREKLRYRKLMNKINRRLGSINRKIKRIRVGNLSQAQKRRHIDVLQAEKKRLTKMTIAKVQG